MDYPDSSATVTEKATILTVIGDGEQQFSSRPRTPEELREQIAGLCLQVELLRHWFGKHESQLRAAGDLAVTRVYDCFIMSAAESRSLAQQAGVELDRAYIDNFDWHPPSKLVPKPDVGPHSPLRYTGGTLGLGSDKPQIAADGLSGHYTLTVEQTLYNIDQFQEPGRSRLQLEIGHYFGVDLMAVAA